MLSVAFDVDDVVLDFGGRVIETVNMEYGTELTLENVTSWNLNPLLDPILGEDWWIWWEEREWLWAKADAVPGAIGGLRWAHQQGYWVELVTAKPDWARAGLSQWLGKWQPYFDRLTVGPARPPMFKPFFTDALVLVDDKPENCQDFADVGRYALLFERPHNIGYAPARPWYNMGPPIAGELTRVQGWGHIKQALKAIEEEEARCSSELQD